MPDAMLAHLIRPAGCVAGVGRIRRVKRRIRQLIQLRNIKSGAVDHRNDLFYLCITDIALVDA